MTSISDDEPFDTSTGSLDLGLVRDSAEESRAQSEARRALRLRANQWGAERGFEVVDSGLMRVAESVEVVVEFSATTAEMCTLRSKALQPTELHVQVERKSWTDWVAARVGRHFETADRVFDEMWHVKTDNEPVAKRLLDARVRTALSHHPIWCRAVYTNGHIELHLDSGTDRLNGGHVLAATEVAVALSRATTQTSAKPYR